MRKIFSMILCFAIMAVNFTAVSAKEDDVTVTLDGNEIDFPDAKPFIDSRARTLVPIRFVSEAMGANVDWDGDTRTVSIKKDKDTIKYTIGNAKAFINDEMVVCDTYGMLKDDRTFVPLRYISELLYCDVEWDESTREVTITSPSDVVKFPQPQIKVNYPETEGDKRLFWITLENSKDFQRECPNYEYKIECLSPAEFNTFEQDEGDVLGWQQASRVQFTRLTIMNKTIFSVNRAYYTTRENMKTFIPTDGMELKFKLTVLRKCSGEEREYIFTEKMKLPYSVVRLEE